MSFSFGLDPYAFARKMERTQPMVKEMDGHVFISRQSWRFLFVFDLLKVLFRICALTWRVNDSFSPRKNCRKKKRKY